MNAKRFVVAVCLVAPALASTLMTSPAQAADGCASPANQASPTTLTYLSGTVSDGRTIELRYSAASRCAWGRVQNGSPGDKIWLNRSYYPDGNPHTDLTNVGGSAYIAGGYTSVFTPQAFSDAGVYMNVCEQDYNRPTIHCTAYK